MRQISRCVRLRARDAAKTILIGAGAAVGSMAIAAPYDVISVPLISNSEFNIANDIDPHGRVVGYFRMDDGTNLAFRYSPFFGFSDLLNPLPGDDNSEALATGYVGITCGTSDGTPVRWLNDDPPDLLDPDGLATSARGTNRVGLITGQRIAGLSETHAYLWSLLNGFQDLGTLGGDDAEGRDVNLDGNVCGWSIPASGGGLRAFLWDSTNGMQNLGNLSGFQWSVGVALNDSDEVACQATNVIPTANRAFLWRNGQRTDLGELPGADAVFVDDINNNTQIVGWCTFGFSSRAFIWYDGVMHDLNDLIDPNSGWVIEQAVGINDTGEIAATAVRNNVRRAVTLVPNYRNGAVIVNNTDDHKAYVLDPQDGHFLGTFGTAYAKQGVEIIDGEKTGPSTGLLMSDFATGRVMQLFSDGSKNRDWSSAAETELRGIAKSVAGFYVGATAKGFVAWSEFGTRQPDTVPGDFHDIILFDRGAQKYYVMTEDAEDNIEGYKLNLKSVGQSKRNGIPNPQQITTAWNGKYYLVASFDKARIYGLFTSNGKPAGSFATLGIPTGIIQLDNRQYMVSTNKGLHIYNAAGSLVRTELKRTGFQYISKCFNYDP